MTQCPCGTGKELADCCGPVLAGAPARTAETLMRSRYTAYVLGNIDYLHKTVGGEAALTFDRAYLEQSLPDTQWLGLNILDVEGGEQTDTSGAVKFEVAFRQDGRLHRQVERSVFRRVDHAWRYCSGEMELTSAPQPILKAGRNDPCTCGSGRKFKKCCGAG